MTTSTECLPLAGAALHPDWPEARFNVSGMFTHHRLILELISMAQQTLNCRLPIESIHGAPAVLWNAGRPSAAPFSAPDFTSLLNTLYSHNIGYYPTFTNHLLESADLKDPRSNYILDAINQRPDLNGVILSSDLLSKYIAEKYPALRQVASIVKVTFEKGQGRPDYYHQLGQRFSRYVVHPDDCRDLHLLNQLDRDQAEIIVNENCAIHCPQRAHHYDAYARWQKLVNAPQVPAALNSINPVTERRFVEQEMVQIKGRCQAPLDLDCLAKQNRSCYLSSSETKAVYDLGFRHFKLQGRADDPIFYAYDLVHFLLEPQFVAQLFYKTLLSRTMLRRRF